MTIRELDNLIAEARGLANDHPCTRGHSWESIGGKPCFDCGGSKLVYECVICGDCDYGDRVQCGFPENCSQRGHS